MTEQCDDATNGSDEFDQLLTRSEYYEQVGEGMTVLQDQYRRTLETQGENFSTGLEATTNRAQLLHLVVKKMMIDVVLEANADSLNDTGIGTIKKETQAQLELGGFSESWTRLVSSELPGEDLQPDDLETRAKVFSQSLDISEGTALEMEQDYAFVDGFLEQQNIEVSEEQRIALDVVVSIKGVTKAAARLGSGLEKSRDVLSSADMTGEIWQKFLNEFFTQ